MRVPRSSVSTDRISTAEQANFGQRRDLAAEAPVEGLVVGDLLEVGGTVGDTGEPGSGTEHTAASLPRPSEPGCTGSWKKCALKNQASGCTS